MIINYLGTNYGFDLDAVGVDEWRELKRKYKMTPGQFETGLAEADPDAMTFAFWVMLRQNGQMNAILGDQLKPDILALNKAIAIAQAAEAEEQEETAPEPDPTKGSPSTPTSSTPAPLPASAPAPPPPAAAAAAASATG